MEFASLVRRKRQVALLESACKCGAAATIRILDAGDASPDPTRFVASLSEGILMRCPARQAFAEPTEVRVEIRFTFEQATLCFRAWTRGVRPHRSGRCLLLSHPTALDRVERRHTQRWRVPESGALTARIASLIHPDQVFDARVATLSGAGVSVIGKPADAWRIAAGDPHRIELRRDGKPCGVEFLARLAHRTLLPETDASVGWTAAPADDPRILTQIASDLARLALAIGAVPIASFDADGADPC